MEKTKKLLWDDKYNVGVKIIDEQHQTLFAIINELFDAINNVPNKENVAAITKRLIDYRLMHFATEEKIFKECEYEKIDEHREIHRAFSDKIDSMQKEYGNDPIVFAFKLVDYLEDWIIEHLMNSDKDYKKSLQDYGIK